MNTTECWESNPSLLGKSSISGTVVFIMAYFHCVDAISLTLLGSTRNEYLCELCNQVTECSIKLPPSQQQTLCMSSASEPCCRAAPLWSPWSGVFHSGASGALALLEPAVRGLDSSAGVHTHRGDCSCRENKIIL